MKKKINVVAALIRRDDKYLLCERREGDRFAFSWEFPGGSVEEGESLFQAIEREIKEELDLDIHSDSIIRVFYDEDERLKIKVHLCACSIIGGIPKAKECNNFGFFTLTEIRKLNLAPVDKKIFNYLISQKNYPPFLC
jgi:8-oxo-dGTP diphosphatase